MIDGAMNIAKFPVCAVLVAVSIVSCNQDSELQSQQAADWILTGGKFFTVEDRQPWRSKKMCQVNYRKKNLSRTGAVDKHSRLKPLPHYFLALWERLFVQDVFMSRSPWMGESDQLRILNTDNEFMGQQ